MEVENGNKEKCVARKKENQNGGFRDERVGLPHRLGRVDLRRIVCTVNTERWSRSCRMMEECGRVTFKVTASSDNGVR